MTKVASLTALHVWHVGILDQGLSSRNMLLSTSLVHYLLLSATDPETSSCLALCEDLFYSKWICLFVLLFIPSFTSVFITGLWWLAQWIILALRLWRTV